MSPGEACFGNSACSLTLEGMDSPVQVPWAFG